MFDGKCKLCDFSVNFLLDRDDKDIFRFCTIQSDVGKEILKYHKLPENDISTPKGSTFIRNGPRRIRICNRIEKIPCSFCAVTNSCGVRVRCQ